MGNDKKKWFKAVEGVKVYTKVTHKSNKSGGVGPFENEGDPKIIDYIESKYDGSKTAIYETNPFKLAPGIVVSPIKYPTEELDLKKRCKDILL